jgi:HEAT repeat protein
MSEPSQPKTPAGPSRIPPFQDQQGQPGGFKAVLQLFLVPLSIVIVAGGIFLTMNFLVGNESSPEEILDKVASGDSRRRGQAAFELSLRLRAEPQLLEDSAFRARLLSIYESSEGGGAELRRYLTQVLSSAEFPEAIPALLRATEDQDGETRLYATAALGNAAAPEAFERLVELTRDADPGVRSVAAASLGNLGDGRAIGPLEARLNDPAVEVAWNAANALAHLESTAGEGVLRRMLDESYLSTVAGITDEQKLQAMLAAVQGLTKLEAAAPDAERRSGLEEIAKMAPYPEVRNAAMRALQSQEEG